MLTASINVYASIRINYVTQHEHYSLGLPIQQTRYGFIRALLVNGCRTFIRHSRYNSIHVEFNILKWRKSMSIAFAGKNWTRNLPSLSRAVGRLLSSFPRMQRQRVQIAGS